MIVHVSDNELYSLLPRSTSLHVRSNWDNIIVKVSVFGFRAHAYTAVIMISPGYIILGSKKTE